MSVIDLVNEALTQVGVPFARLKYSGKAPTYIEYYEYLETGETFAEDDEELTAHYISVNLFSPVDYTETVKKIKEKMKAKGFIRLQEFELFDEVNKSFSRTIRFYFLESMKGYD